MFADGPQLAPDLFAEFERLSGKTLGVSGSYDLARVHFDRAASVFGAIGHSLGRARTLRELISLSEKPSASNSGVEIALDRLRTLLDMRNRAELFGREAVLLLQELNCAESVDLQIVDPESSSRPESVALNGSPVTHLQTDISIVLGSSAHKRVTLSFVPLGDPKSQLIALSFKRVISQILASRTTDTTFGDHDIVWTSSNSTATEQGVVFASESMLSQSSGQ